tara:strand:- start:2429 stop:3223 length:795 start_codon:yes stop_codon:yes gene_type:complete
MFRAQDAVQKARPYAEKLTYVLGSLVAAIPEYEDPNPFLVRRDENKVAVVVFTSNRGLAGAVNSNVVRQTIEHIEQLRSANPGVDVSIIGIGKVGVRMLNKVAPIHSSYLDVPDQPSVSDVSTITDLAKNLYESREFDAIDVVFPSFVNTINQSPSISRLLPIEPVEHKGEELTNVNAPNYIYEPSAVSVLKTLIPRYLEIAMYRFALEASASEHSARMVAMRNATDNASELIDDLTLLYNRQRQSAITSEMIDIASGASALSQ